MTKKKKFLEKIKYKEDGQLLETSIKKMEVKIKTGFKNKCCNMIKYNCFYINKLYINFILLDFFLSNIQN